MIEKQSEEYKASNKQYLNFINEWEKIIKYASNGKDTVAFHCIYNYNEENGCVEFVFAVSYGEELEIPSSNSNLDISDKVIGEYKYTLFATDDVRYHEKLMLDTTTGEVTVISDKK